MKNRIILLTLFLIMTLGYSQFNSYVPQIPVRAMRDVGMYKQRLYDERSKWIQQEIYRLNDLNNSLFDEEKLPADFGTLKHKTKLNKMMAEYVDGIKAYDFADDYYNNEVEVYNSKKK
jgi:hypothetical protein